MLCDRACDNVLSQVPSLSCCWTNRSRVQTSPREACLQSGVWRLGCSGAGAEAAQRPVVQRCRADEPNPVRPARETDTCAARSLPPGLWLLLLVLVTHGCCGAEHGQYSRRASAASRNADLQDAGSGLAGVHNQCLSHALARPIFFPRLRTLASRAAEVKNSWPLHRKQPMNPGSHAPVAKLVVSPKARNR